MEYTYDDGVTRTLEMEIVGKNHDTLAGNEANYNEGRNTAALTFISKDIVPKNRRMNATSKNFEGYTGLAAGGWEHSDQRAWMNSTFRGYLPQVIRANIKSVIKVADYGKDAARLDGGTANELWIPSDVELNAENTEFVLAGQGHAYPVFIDDFSRQKMSGNSGNAYWTRSTSTKSVHQFRYVNTAGGMGSQGGANALGFVVGFCI